MKILMIIDGLKMGGTERRMLSLVKKLEETTDIEIEIWDHHREQGPDFRVDKFHYSAVGANTTLLVQELKRTLQHLNVISVILIIIRF